MIAAAWILLSVLASGPVDLVVLKVAGRVVAVVPADVDGGGENDILVFWRQGYPPGSCSRISVFSSTGGRISRTPAQVLSLPEGVVAFDVGEVDSDSMADVLLLARDGVWAFSGQSDGRFSEEPVSVVKVMTVAALPHEDHVPRMLLLISLDGKGRKGLLVPTVPIGPLTLYERDQQGDWFLRQVLRVPTSSDVYTSAEDFRFARDFGAIFQLTFPRCSVSDQNGDRLLDLVFLIQDAVAVFRARPSGSFPQQPDLYRNFALVEPEERVQPGVLVRGEAGDVNGDGREDLLFNKTVGGISNMKSEVRLYLARSTGDYPKLPDFVAKRDGYGASVRLLDVDADGRADMVRPHVDMGLTTLIGMMLSGRIDLTFEVYLSKNGTLPANPDFNITSTLGINFRSNQELTGPYPIFQEDFTGDGIGDLVVGCAGCGSGDMPDRLEIRPGTRSGKFSDDATWHLDLPGTRFVLPFRLRPDGRPGLLIYFSLVKKHQGDVWVLHNVGGFP